MNTQLMDILDRIVQETNSPRVVPPFPVVVELTANGVHRTLDTRAGLTFLVDSFTVTFQIKSTEYVAHVRDYRYFQPAHARDFQIWSLSPGHYKVVSEIPKRYVTAEAA